MNVFPKFLGADSGWMQEGAAGVKCLHGGLRYREPSFEFLVSAVEGNGYTIVVENMGAVDRGLAQLSITES
jgi:hypothetical protein